MVFPNQRLSINLRQSIDTARDLKQKERDALLQGRVNDANRLKEVRKLALEQLFDAVAG